VNKQTRDRLMLPLLMPLGILATIFVLTFGFSRILLAVSAHAATATAVFLVALIIVFASLTARSRRIVNSQLLVMLAVVAGGAAMAGGAALATVGGREAEQPEKPAVERASVSIGAKDIKFDKAELEVPSGKPLAIEFDNEDSGVPHNIVIFDGSDAGAPALFTGKIVTGPTKVRYEVDPLKDGSYFFHCEVHPTMTGTVVAGAGSERTATSPSPQKKTQVEPKGSPVPQATPAVPAGGTTISLVAPPNAVVEGFAEKSLTAPASQPLTIAFDNQEAGIPHNVEIFKGTDASGEKVFAPPDNAGVTGPGKADYQVPALEPGSYFYHCFFHPTTMTGTLKVE